MLCVSVCLCVCVCVCVCVCLSVCVSASVCGVGLGEVAKGLAFYFESRAAWGQ